MRFFTSWMNPICTRESGLAKTDARWLITDTWTAHTPSSPLRHMRYHERSQVSCRCRLGVRVALRHSASHSRDQRRVRVKVDREYKGAIKSGTRGGTGLPANLVCEDRRADLPGIAQRCVKRE
jgi:hypothetical protein